MVMEDATQFYNNTSYLHDGIVLGTHEVVKKTKNKSIQSLKTNLFFTKYTRYDI